MAQQQQQQQQQPKNILSVRLVERGGDMTAFKTVFQLGPYPGWTLALAELALHFSQAAAQVMYANPQRGQWQALAEYDNGTSKSQAWLDWEFKHIIQLACAQNEAIQKDMEEAAKLEGLG